MYTYLRIRLSGMRLQHLKRIRTRTHTLCVVRPSGFRILRTHSHVTDALLRHAGACGKYVSAPELRHTHTKVAVFARRSKRHSD